MPGDGQLFPRRAGCTDLLQHVDRAGNRSLRQERRAAVEQEVAAVENLALRGARQSSRWWCEQVCHVPYVCAQVVDP